MVDLARTLPDPPTAEKLKEQLPALYERLIRLDRNAIFGDGDPRYRVLATRLLALRFVKACPEVDSLGIVTLDAGGVEVASPSFLDELLRCWPGASLVNANEDVQDSWDTVHARLADPCRENCRRRSLSSYMEGPWTCGSCGRLREDLNNAEREWVIKARRVAVYENAWLESLGLPLLTFGVREAREALREAR